MKGGMETQGAELYPHPEAGLATELHSPAKPEKLREANKHPETLHS